jgi:hypothetical protein
MIEPARVVGLGWGTAADLMSLVERFNNPASAGKPSVTRRRPSTVSSWGARVNGAGSCAAAADVASIRKTARSLSRSTASSRVGQVR